MFRKFLHSQSACPAPSVSTFGCPFAADGCARHACGGKTPLLERPKRLPEGAFAVTPLHARTPKIVQRSCILGVPYQGSKNPYLLSRSCLHPIRSLHLRWAGLWHHGSVFPRGRPQESVHRTILQGTLPHPAEIEALSAQECPAALQYFDRIRRSRGYPRCRTALLLVLTAERAMRKKECLYQSAPAFGWSFP